MRGATHVTVKGEECVDLTWVSPRCARYRRLAGVTGRQEFHACLFGTPEAPRLEWVNAGNLRRLPEPAATDGPWATLVGWR
jgi:hypothetical protein